MSAPKSNDAMIRSALVKRLLGAGITRDCIRHEITLDSSSSDGRADLVLLSADAIIGVEIKSGKDTLDRLVEQRPRYAARFDRCVIVCDGRHRPWDDNRFSWQGWETCAADFVDGSILFRENYYSGFGAMTSPFTDWWARSGHLSPRAMLKMLWRGEVAAIYGDAKISRVAAIPHIAETVPLREIRRAVASALRRRQLNRWEETFWRTFDAGAAEVAA